MSELWKQKVDMPDEESLMGGIGESIDEATVVVIHNQAILGAKLDEILSRLPPPIKVEPEVKTELKCPLCGLRLALHTSSWSGIRGEFVFECPKVKNDN